ncbi:phospholipase A [Bacteriovorax sp. Seq25_V]|uniref:phospholipase A n=1 Tax=Bacteriovorax sp. Seq25_V TaxID=1201288 RepID=UPI00038A42DA|nr:phospholipase A [Bacteriovorax sp. Seq25_V]EQC45672.1 outer membrane phospholipase A family protein [Bacteriovorax sp. Seq25_V]
MKNKFLLVLFSLLHLTSAADGFESKIKNEYNDLLSKKYALLPHKGTFLIPFSYNNTPNNESYKILTERSEFQDRGAYNRRIEAEFQISFLFLISKDTFNSDFNLFVGYTQQSWWQVYNKPWSRQFRETNYNPEIFARNVMDNPTKFLGGEIVAYDFGYMHQSNGQIQELSRSWDRLFVRGAFVFGKTIVTPTLWYRLPDPDKKDENPDTEKFIGFGEIRVDRVYGRNRLGLRVIPGTHSMGVELSHSYPLTEGVRLFTKINYGYGMSLIDYNHKAERFGIGVTLTDLLSSVSN